MREAFCPRTVFITGGNRGIGLGLVRKFCELPKAPDHVFATCRDPDTAKVSYKRWLIITGNNHSWTSKTVTYTYLFCIS